MPIVTTSDGGWIMFFKDWAGGLPVVFSHRWPLDADAWDGPAKLRCVARRSGRWFHDRRCGAGPRQPSTGNDLDHYADDLAAVTGSLDLRDMVLVGHSTGGGEVTGCVGRHGTARIAKMVLLGPIPPLMLETDANPEGLPMAGVRRDG